MMRSLADLVIGPVLGWEDPDRAVRELHFEAVKDCIAGCKSTYPFAVIRHEKDDKSPLR